MADFHASWMRERIICLNPHTEVKKTEIAAFITASRPDLRVFELVTESGQKVVATADHPFMTAGGMVPLGDLTLGQYVSVYPFEGVPYAAPSNDVLITEADIRRIYPGHANGLSQLLKVLQKKRLLPLTVDHPALPYLIKLLGFCQGDGSLHFLKGGGSQLTFYAGPADLEAIRQDVQTVGFIPSRIYARHRSHAIDTMYGRREFSFTESYVHVRSTALAALLVALGATPGNKARTNFEAPAWLDGSPLWMKRLFLAALFGAEMSAPKTVTGHPYNFYCPILSLNKERKCVESGRKYLDRIRVWLSEFGVVSNIIDERKEYTNRVGLISIRLRLQISSQPENLIRVWSLIGFEYNRRKQYLANVAVQYLRLKSLALEERREGLALAQWLAEKGLGPKAIVSTIDSPFVNENFVGRSLHGLKPDFPTFLERATQGLGETGQVWDRIVRKDHVPFDGPVYDFTVKDPYHNFIANSFVVSNCGVRLIRTDLTEGDVRPKLTELVDVLFHTVPSGVGVGGRVKVGMNEIDDVLSKGARWAVGKGYGVACDLDVIEAGGALPGAD
ncbi:MAG: RtcB family protein, partial [bacterium]